MVTVCPSQFATRRTLFHVLVGCGLLMLKVVVWYEIAASYIACKIHGSKVIVCPSQFATRRTLLHILVGCGLVMLKVSRVKLPVIWLLVSMWLNTLTKSQIWTLLLKV